MSYNEIAHLQQQFSTVQTNLSSINQLLDEIINLDHNTHSSVISVSLVTSYNNPTDILFHIQSILENFDVCGDNIEVIEDEVNTMVSILNQPSVGTDIASRTGFVFKDPDSLDHNPTSKRLQHDSQLIRSGLDSLIRQYDRLEAKIQSTIPSLQQHYSTLLSQQQQQQQQQHLTQNEQKKSHSTSVPPTLPHKYPDPVIQQPNIISLLQLPSLATPLAVTKRPTNTTNITNMNISGGNGSGMDDISELTNRFTRTKPKTATLVSSSSSTTTSSSSSQHSQPAERLQQKKAFTSTVMQQQILESLQRSRESLGENLQKTQSSYDTLLMSSEMLTLINQDATSAKENSDLSASLTRKHEQKAIMEKYMVRWSFIFFLCVAGFIVFRRSLWFATPLIYATKGAFGLAGIFQSITLWFVSLFGIGNGVSASASGSVIANTVANTAIGSASTTSISTTAAQKAVGVVQDAIISVAQHGIDAIPL